MNAYYSPIAPLPLLRAMLREGLLDPYLLLLAHDVLADPLGYNGFATEFAASFGNSDDVFIVMDNSVVELGKPMSISSVVEAADIVAADAIMTPDVLGNFAATQQAVEANHVSLQHLGFHLMRVPQGQNMAELIQCVDWLRATLPSPRGQAEYWGVPRWVANKLGSRAGIVKYILMSGNENTRVHLLGMSLHIRDDLECARLGGVQGIDSANPCVAGHVGWGMDLDKHVHWDRGSYWERTELNDKIRENIRFIHEQLGHN